MPTVSAKGIRMNEAEFDQEFDVDAITLEIVNNIKTEVKSKYGNRKRHKQ